MQVSDVSHSSLADLRKRAERVRRLLSDLTDARVAAALNEYLAELEAAIRRQESAV
jgi:hypothetical protein